MHAVEFQLHGHDQAFSWHNPSTKSQHITNTTGTETIYPPSRWRQNNNSSNTNSALFDINLNDLEHYQKNELFSASKRSASPVTTGDSEKGEMRKVTSGQDQGRVVKFHQLREQKDSTQQQGILLFWVEVSGFEIIFWGSKG